MAIRVWTVAGISLSALMLANSGPAHADGVGQLVEALGPPNNRIQSAYLKLENMLLTLPTAESPYAAMIAVDGAELAGYVRSINNVALLGSLVHNAADEKIGRAVLKSTVSDAFSAANNEIQDIDRQLSSISNRTAYGQATQLRDAMIEIRDILKPLSDD